VAVRDRRKEDRDGVTVQPSDTHRGRRAAGAVGSDVDRVTHVRRKPSAKSEVRMKKSEVKAGQGVARRFEIMRNNHDAARAAP
jgi:hypothetical protein